MIAPQREGVRRSLTDWRLRISSCRKGFLVFSFAFFHHQQEKQPFEMSNYERIEAAGKKKEEGNRLFKGEKYRQAIRRYNNKNM
ncbi:hypothetical protein AAC387_Pa01g4038 [Persea americana]